jgi:hypothetical protein
MTVSVTFNMRMDVTETLDVDVDSAAQPVIQHSALSIKKTLNASSTPAATKHSQQVYSLSGGAKTIDLTALLSTYGKVLDCTGLKVRLIRFENLGTATMTIGKGASSGYDLFGGTIAPAVAAPDGTTPTGLMQSFGDGLAAVDGTHKTIDVTGTGTDQFALSLVLG